MVSCLQPTRQEKEAWGEKHGCCNSESSDSTLFAGNHLQIALPRNQHTKLIVIIILQSF